MAKRQVWLQPLHKPEHVALGVTGRIPPAASGVADDQDLAPAPPVFEAALRAFLSIQLPRRRRSLEHDRAMDRVAQCLDLWVKSCHFHFPSMSAGVGLSGLWPCSAPALPAIREADALQGRAERAGACDAPLTARPALAVAISRSFASYAKVELRRREREKRGRCCRRTRYRPRLPGGVEALKTRSSFCGVLRTRERDENSKGARSFKAATPSA
jgi:hypothetical protein